MRSSGPGGQNVNKVNSKAVLRWSLAENTSLSSGVRLRIMTKLASQLTVLGEIVITSDRFRDQIRNREDCLEKFEILLKSAAAHPKSRRKTKPSYSSKLKGKKAKSMQSQKKKLRSGSHDFD